MTDDEIIKALKCCVNEADDRCFGCPLRKYGDCFQIKHENAIDLINQQKAEIERLNIELQAMRSAANSYKKHYETAIQKKKRGE